MALALRENMEVFKYVFWILTTYLFFTLCLRVFWFVRSRYYQLSWFAEWFLALTCCVGIYGVAYNTQIINQGFWWFVLVLIIVSSILRLRSLVLQSQLKQLTNWQLLFVRCLMASFTLPLVTGVFFNAANLSGIW